ncbi:hypothetical protein KQX54_005592 [Cotesia glomerata]|uniref:Uncharacterized protein n=1 Tax=Cotesia glomerata TaxID=32391 RepID=A0AAV7IYV9_COTGL|nr:hypothetical protein KQX54_005592 [Cotesia glomerata]
MDKVTSLHGRADQIVMRFLMTKFVESAIYSGSVTAETRKFICKTLKIPNLTDEVVINKDFQAMSSPEVINLREFELNVLLQTGYVPINSASSYTKIKINGIDYHSKNDNDNKFCNPIISYKNKFGEILSIIDFENQDNSNVQDKNVSAASTSWLDTKKNFIPEI